MAGRLAHSKGGGPRFRSQYVGNAGDYEQRLARELRVGEAQHAVTARLQVGVARAVALEGEAVAGVSTTSRASGQWKSIR